MGWAVLELAGWGAAHKGGVLPDTIVGSWGSVFMCRCIHLRCAWEPRPQCGAHGLLLPSCHAAAQLTARPACARDSTPASSLPQERTRIDRAQLATLLGASNAAAGGNAGAARPSEVGGSGGSHSCSSRVCWRLGMRHPGSRASQKRHATSSCLSAPCVRGVVGWCNEGGRAT
jgi:hypothetical protein